MNLPVLLCFTLYLRAIFQVQAPRGLIFGGAILRRVFCVTSLGGLFSEFYGMLKPCIKLAKCLACVADALNLLFRRVRASRQQRRLPNALSFRNSFTKSPLKYSKTDFPIFHLLQIVSLQAFDIPKADNSTISYASPYIGHYKEYPPPPPPGEYVEYFAGKKEMKFIFYLSHLL